MHGGSTQIRDIVGAMTWQIVDVRAVTSTNGLSPLDLEQLRIAGQHYDGVDRAPELRFVELPPTPENDPDGMGYDGGCLVLTGFLSLSRVLVDGVLRFDLWRLDPDAASLFSAGTTEIVAGRCQSSWMTPDLRQPFSDAAALDEAMHAAKIW